MPEPATAPACTDLEDADGLFGRKAQEDRQTCCPYGRTACAGDVRLVNASGRYYPKNTFAASRTAA